MSNPKTQKKLEKKEMESCGDKYCNPECVGTIYEKGKGLSKSFLEKRKKFLKLLKKEFEENRKNIFGNKENVLNDSFYEKLSPKDVENLKKMGAISGCISKL
jgi:hypothetical protein